MPAKPLTKEQREDAARLKAVFERTKESNPSVTQESVAAACGWKTQGTVSQYINGKIPLNLSALFKFCDVFSVQPEEISPSLARQQMISSVTKSIAKPGRETAALTQAPQLVSLTEHPGLVEVPRVQFKLSAGVSGFAVDVEGGNGKPIFFREDWFKQHGFRPEKLFAVRISGQSMEPRLWEGDLVVINTASAAPKDGEPFALNYEGELVIKRLRRDAGEWWACSDNPDQQRYAPKRCTEDVKIIGMVVYRQGERI